MWPALLIGMLLAVSPVPAAAMSCEAMIDAHPTKPLRDWVKTNCDKIASLLRPEDKPAYSAAIKAGHCPEAEAVIAGRFRDAFPAMACFFAPPTVLRPDSAMVWRIYVAKHAFPDLGLCFAETDLQRGLAALRKAGLPAPRVVWPVDPKVLDRAFGRFANDAWRVDSALAQMDLMCRLENYLPACVAFARVANEGVLVKKTDDFLYFYVVRIRLAGFDSPERRRLEKEIGARLTPQARARDEERARLSIAGRLQVRMAFPQDRYPGLPPPGDD